MNDIWDSKCVCVGKKEWDSISKNYEHIYTSKCYVETNINLRELILLAIHANHCPTTGFTPVLPSNAAPAPPFHRGYLNIIIFLIIPLIS